MALVEVTRHGPVARVIVNRPEVRNALNLETRRELRSTVESLGGDPGVRSLVFQGAGEKAFVAGADLNDMRRLDVLGGLDYVRSLGQGLYNQIAALEKPTVASIRGYALGGGCELALACDLRIASMDAVLGLPEVNVGLFPAGGGSQRMPQMGMPGLTLGAIMAGELLDAHEAHRRGLVNRVVPPGDLERISLEVAQRLAEKPPTSLRFAKRALAHTDGGDYTAEALLFAALLSGKDPGEGMSAFLEKRKPKFTGR